MPAQLLHRLATCPGRALALIMMIGSCLTVAAAHPSPCFNSRSYARTSRHSSGYENPPQGEEQRCNC